MRQKITAGRLWGLISPMVLYMIVQVVVSGIVTFGIIFAANFVLHDYATFSASKIGMKIAEENILLELLISQIITAPVLIKWLKDDINLDKETGFFKKFKRTSAFKFLLIIPFGITTMFCANYFVSILQMFMPKFMIDSYVGTSEALTSGPFIIQALATAVGAPIVEELMFRGVIYRRLRRMAGVIPSAIIVSLLFGVYHGNWIQAPYALLLGMACVYVYERYKSIIAPMILHVTANFVAILITFFATISGESVVDQHITYSVQDLIVLIVFVIITGILTFLLYRVINKKVVPEEIN